MALNDVLKNYFRDKMAVDIRYYKDTKAALPAMEEEYQMLRSSLNSVKSSWPKNSERVQGGIKEYERALNIMARAEELALDIYIAKKRVEWMEKAWDALDAESRTLLEAFYIERRPGERAGDVVQGLMETMGYERSQVYNLKNQALLSLALKRYGIYNYAD